VMDAGRVVALDTPQGLIARYAGGVRVVFSTDAADVSFLNEVTDVDSVRREGPRVVVEGRGAVLVHVAAALAARGLTPPDVRLEQPTLEDVFLALTGHEMPE